MAISQPVGTDLQPNPSHSLAHRVFAVDPSSPAKTVVVDASGNTKIGDEATNYTKFDATGHQTMLASARPWRDELNDASNLKQSGSGITINPTESVVEFLHTAEESDYMYLNLQLNHDRDESANIYPHIHWFAAEQAVVPNFEIWYRWQVISGTKVTSWSKILCKTPEFAAPANGVTNHQVCHSAGIATPPGSNISDIVQFRVIRNHSNSSNLHGGQDPYTATVAVLAFDVHIQINSLGSTDEYAK